MSLVFTVHGVALPKGNMKPFMVRSKTTGMKIPILTESNRNVKSWSQLVAQGASLALQAKPESERGFVLGGVRLTVAFFLPRPKKYQKRGVNPAHLTKPDLDKLVRAVKDALTHVVWQDDSQVIELVARKDYTLDVDASPCVHVRVEEAFGGTGFRAVAKATEGSVLPLFEG